MELLKITECVRKFVPVPPGYRLLYKVFVVIEFQDKYHERPWKLSSQPITWHQLRITSTQYSTETNGVSVGALSTSPCLLLANNHSKIKLFRWDPDPRPWYEPDPSSQNTFRVDFQNFIYLYTMCFTVQLQYSKIWFSIAEIYIEIRYVSV